jgi:hypothetical protein
MNGKWKIAKARSAVLSTQNQQHLLSLEVTNNQHRIALATQQGKCTSKHKNFRRLVAMITQIVGDQHVTINQRHQVTTQKVIFVMPLKKYQNKKRNNIHFNAGENVARTAAKIYIYKQDRVRNLSRSKEN